MLFLLNILAIGSVQSVAIGYPHSTLWTYNPAQIKYPLKSGVHGYLRYLDHNAAQSIVDYNNPQPVYAVRQISYIKSASPVLETYVINESDDSIKNREASLRAASLEQYQKLKHDMDALRTEGKEPSVEILLKLQTLEKIAFASDFSLIAELPEVKCTLQDLEVNISGLDRESVQQSSNQELNVDRSQGEIKTYIGNSNIPLVAIEETPEQRKAREDHLRIYNEQIAHLKQLELQHQQYVQQASLKSKIQESQNVDNAKALAELERAQQEHFRLWNEAKLDAEQAGDENGEKSVIEKAEKQQISALINDQNIYNTRQTILNIENPEIQRAQAAVEHQPFEQQGPKSFISNSKQKHDVIDGPKFVKVQEEHLRSTYQAKLKNEQNNQDNQAYALQQVVDTPDVARPREEHLRIDSEAISRARAQEQRFQNIDLISEAEKSKLSTDQSTYESIRQQIPIAQSHILQASSPSPKYKVDQSVVVETPEVIKAREEHLRLVHEANLRAQFVEQQELKYKHESETPILKTQYEHQQLIYHPETSQIVQETPEVAQARAEHLRLVNEALKLNANLGEQNDKRIIFPSQEQQQTTEAQFVRETHEVQRAREEHLRIFNAVKSQVEQEQTKQSGRVTPDPATHGKPILDYSIEEERLLELERLHGAERLQKEQQQLELDRGRETERLAEEKRQMEADLIRLRLKEEQRLEKERLFEAKRLQQENEELEKLKNGEYEEVIIQNDSADQQPQIPIVISTQPTSSSIEQARSQLRMEIVGQQYVNNPFLKDSHISSEQPVNRLEHSVSLHSDLLKAAPVQDPTSIYQHNSESSHNAVQSSDNIVPSLRHMQSSHQSSGIKHQYIKDDNIKHKHYDNTVSSQPADMAEALIALEKATNDHFRAHELALERLRLARLQNLDVKDCN